MVKKIVVVIALSVTIIIGGRFVSADEGMWLLNNLPLNELKDKYNFTPTAGWVERVQKSSARLPNCSSFFVSADGLLKTNWHCAEDAVKQLSTPGNNYYENGFYARTYNQELKTGLNIRVLMSMTDVTQRINNAVAKDTSGNPAKARQEIISQIQKETEGLSEVINSFKCEVVVLYQGGQYQLYCYKVYDDIRLVFMPERNVGFFGGDTDNFEYPRYTLDVSFFRVYENNKPAKIEHYFKWSKSGAKEGELIFVSGHPGRTARMLTSSALKTERDVRVPFLLDLFRRRELTTTQFMIRSKENRQVSESDLFSWQNSRKLYTGKIRGLQDTGLMHEKQYWESETSVGSKDPTVAPQLVEGRKLVEEAQSVIRGIYPKYMLLARGFGFDSQLYGYAASIVSGNKEFAKSVLAARQKEQPINLEYEEAKLRDSLTHLVEVFGADDEMVYSMVNTFGSPSNIARRLVNGTDLVDINEHKSIVDGGPRIQVIDPMVEFALHVKSESETYTKTWNEAVEKERQGYAKISDALFKMYGTDRYPDATFTLRLSFGKVSGYSENGKVVPPWTTIGGAYKHSQDFENQGDWRLPLRWHRERHRANPSKPLNFISTLDITGGNSGSPVFNKDLEIVGLVFDGNIQSLVSDYGYNYSPQSRAISVHSAGITEILSKIYGADRLVKELTKN